MNDARDAHFQQAGSPDRATPSQGLSVRREWPALLVLTLLPLVVFLRPALVRSVFFAYDVQHYFYPYHVLPAWLLKRGELPLWNPYVYGGMPLLGDGQTALFYPPNWLFFLLPGAAALNYDVLLQFGIAGVGTYLFARSLGLWRASSVVGAVAYMFCGCLSTRIVHLSILSGAALVPLAFFAVHNALLAGDAGAPGPVGASAGGIQRHRRPLWLVAVSVTIAAQVLAGHPQVPVYTAIALGLYAAVHGVERWQSTGNWRPATRPLALVGSGILLGYALAAVQLVPWVELGALSVRASGASYELVFQMSVPRYAALQQVFPFLYGALQPGLYGDHQVAQKFAFRMWEHTAYIGLLPIGLAAYAALGLFRSRTGGRLVSSRSYAMAFFVLLVLVGLVFAAGNASPLSDIIYRIPVIGSLRQPARAFVLTDFAVAMLAAFGLQRLAEDTTSEPRPWRWTLLGISIATVALPFAVVALAPNAWLQRALHLPETAVANLRFDRPNALVPLALASAAAMLFAWWSRRGATPLTQTLAAGLLLFDLGHFAATFTPTTSPAFYDTRPESLAGLPVEPGTFRKVTFLPQNNVDDQVAREALAMSWGMVYGVEDINGFNSLQTRRYTDYLFGRQASDVSYAQFADERLLRPESPILSALGVRYLFVPADLRPRIGSGFRQRYENSRVRVYENTLAYPRAYFAETVQALADPSALLATVTADGFDGRRLALIETPQAPTLPVPAEGDRVSMKAWSANAVSLETWNARARFLVLSEMFFPGWRALVDGAETPIYRTNYLFRGIVVPAGHHTVSFNYRPKSLAYGAVVSLLAACVAIGLVVTGRRVFAIGRAAG